jgi:integrase
MGQKNSKGSVTITNNSGRIRLRWRYHKTRYSLNLFSFSKTNLLHAKKVAVSIEHDMLLGSFDKTLQKYNPKYTLTPSETSKKSLVDHFNEWVISYKNRDVNKDVDYNLTMKMLKRIGSLSPIEVLKKLNEEAIAPKTYNTRLRILKGFYNWALKGGLIKANPFEDVSNRKMNKGDRKGRKPFTTEEINAILNAMQKNTFCPVNSRYLHSHYFPFIYFIFQMGVRPAEAIGLRVTHVDFEKKVIQIREALARTILGTHAAARIRKETKNGKQRVLPLDNTLTSILLPLIENKDPDDLVFLSPKGFPIDDKMFQRRVFRKVLEGLGIEHRVLYACRHTFGSRCIHEGLTPVMTAFLMGNNPETALRNYTHLIDLPKSLPAISGPDINNTADL